MRAAAGEPIAIECRYVTRDGVPRWVRNRVQPVRDEDGRVVRLCGAAQDIAVTAVAEVARLQREKLLRDILESLPIGVSFIDRTGHVVEVNDAGRRLWGGERYVSPERYPEFNVRRPGVGG